MRENYKVMVVDDEPIVREAIATQIPWEKHRIEIVKTAAHAIEAMEYLAANEVHLILVDIKMPVISGIEMIRRTREQNTAVEFIVISGYADFSYAQQLMRLGARDYLLKPFNEESLLNTVKAARNEWEQRKLISDLQDTGAAPGPAAGEAVLYSPTIARVLKIIDEEIANKDLSLKLISAERMFLSDNYLGKKFHEEVKQRFSTYLFEHRMILAMRLISKDPDVQIQSVARETGFGDNSQYFSISFKKYTGYTPTEYRRHIHGELWREHPGELNH